MSDHATVTAGPITFAYLEAGPPDGPLALCLHGFPDSANTWRHLLPRLAEAGFHAVAPWLRGYAPTSLAPDGNYQRGALSDDANRLHEALGGDERAVIIGHDWGALATYGAVAHQPDRWRRVVTLAVPPLPIAATAMTSYEQAKRSFYIWLFQTPLAESMVQADDFAFLAGLWRDWTARDDHDAAADLDGVRRALSGEGRTLAAISYYRAMFDASGHDPALAELEAAAFAAVPRPVLYLHGTEDHCLVSPDLESAPDFCGEGSEMRWVDGVGHFSHLEDPATVNDAIIDWVSRH